MTGPNILLICMGSRIRHIKRKSTYEVIGRCNGRAGYLVDGAEAFFVIQEHSVNGVRSYIDIGIPTSGSMPLLSLPITLQQSNMEQRSCLWVIYRCFEDGNCWARPADEFSGRFDLIG